MIQAMKVSRAKEKLKKLRKINSLSDHHDFFILSRLNRNQIVLCIIDFS